MKTISVAIAVMNQQEVTQQCLDLLKKNQQDEVRFIVVDNGSDKPVREWLIGLTGDDIVIRNHKNKGPVKALNQALFVNQSDYLVCLHNDVMVYEKGWDLLIRRNLNDEVGIMGFYGAKGIGTHDIYNTPYRIDQLVRVGPFAGSRCRLNQAVHGYRHFDGEIEQTAVVDGLSIIVKKGLKFWNKSLHHMYPADICLESIKVGLKNYIVNIDFDHLGGRTDVGEDWATPFGKTKQEMHQEAHPPFYEKWRELLPYRV